MEWNSRIGDEIKCSSHGLEYSVFSNQEWGFRVRKLGTLDQDLLGKWLWRLRNERNHVRGTVIGIMYGEV